MKFVISLLRSLKEAPCACNVLVMCLSCACHVLVTCWNVLNNFGLLFHMSEHGISTSASVNATLRSHYSFTGLSHARCFWSLPFVFPLAEDSTKDQLGHCLGALSIYLGGM